MLNEVLSHSFFYPGTGCCMLVVGDNNKELWRCCSYACGRERCSPRDGEDSKEKSKQAF